MGQQVLHLWCACKRVVTIPYRKEWEGLLRDALLARFRCTVCGQRPVDLRRGWDAGPPHLDHLFPTSASPP